MKVAYLDCFSGLETNIDDMNPQWKPSCAPTSPATNPLAPLSRFC